LDKSPEQIQYQVLETTDLINEPYKVVKTATGTLEEMQAEAVKLSKLIADSANLDENELIDAVKDAFQNDEVKNFINEKMVKATHDSDSSMDHYFPKSDEKGKNVMSGEISNQEMERRASSSNVQLESSTITEPHKPKSLLGSLMDQIRARRNDSNVVDNDNKETVIKQENVTRIKSQVESQVVDTQPETVTESLPEININQPENTGIDLQPEIITETKEVKTGLSALFNQIKSRRLEYGSTPNSPRISQLGLGSQELSPLKTKPSLTNLMADTDALFDDELENIVDTAQSVTQNTPNVASSSRLPDEISNSGSSVHEQEINDKLVSDPN
jgi:hypothetical protein